MKAMPADRRRECTRPFRGSEMALHALAISLIRGRYATPSESLIQNTPNDQPVDVKANLNLPDAPKLPLAAVIVSPRVRASGRIGRFTRRRSLPRSESRHL